MAHDTTLITTIVLALVLAYVLGSIAQRLRLPPLVGYLVAGLIAGPNTPGLVIDQSLAPQLAEIGVILLMFGVGLHFSLKDLMSVKTVAIPGVLVEILVIPLLGLGLATLLGWPIAGGLVFGLSLSVASTVVLLKSLQDRHLTDSDRGRLAIGWLIVEDMAMVLALVLTPALADLAHGAVRLSSDPFVALVRRIVGHPVGIYWVVAITLVKLAAFVGFMLIVGRRIIPWLLHFTAHTGSRELFRLAVLAIALGVAAGASYLFGVSLALGAFFAGMILSESELSQRAAEETLPLRDAFAVLFFVSVGMLLKLEIFIEQPLAVLGVLAIILVGKSALAFGITLAFRRPLSSAMTLAASIAQIGEFSFILIALGRDLGLVPDMGQDLIVAGALVSMLVNPLVFFLSERLRPVLEERIRARRPVAADLGPPIRTEPEIGEPAAGPAAEPAAEPAAPPSPEEPETVLSRVNMRNHIVLAGYGRVGSVIAEGLREIGGSFVVLEVAEGRVAAAREAGDAVIAGNAADPEMLRLANLEAARALVVAIPNAFEAGQATEQGRKLNPDLEIIARSHSDEEADYLKHLGADVIMGEREIGLGMLAVLRGERRHETEAAPVAEPQEEPAPAGEAAALDPMHEAQVDEPAEAESGRLAESEAESSTEPVSATEAARAALAEAEAETEQAEDAEAPAASAKAKAEDADEGDKPGTIIMLPNESGPDEESLKDVSPKKPAGASAKDHEPGAA